MPGSALVMPVICPSIDPPTAKDFAKGTGIDPTRENLRDPEKNVTIGSRFLGHLFKTFKNFTALVPPGLTDDEELSWRYQRYMQDYLRCVAALDENVARLLDGLEEQGIGDDTLFMYTSDQGFFLGDHGLFDKRFMYEESIRMPFLVRWPSGIKDGAEFVIPTMN